MKYRIIMNTLLFILILTVSSVASATTLNQAKSQVARQTKGKVVSAYTTNKGGRKIHVIKVVTPKGKVRVVRVPA